METNPILIQLYADSKKTQAAYPVVGEHCIFDSSGVDVIQGIKDDASAKLGDVKHNDTEEEISYESEVGGYKGEVGQTISTTSSTSYHRTMVDVEVGDTYKITTYQSNSASYTHYIFAVNSNNVIIKTWADKIDESASKTYDNIIIPNGATKLAIVDFGSAHVHIVIKKKTVSYVSLQTQIDIISSDEVFSGKKWVVLGDSFTNGATSTKISGGTYNNKSYVYPYLIGNRTGINIVKFFGGGRTLAFPASGEFSNSVTNPSAEYYYQNIPSDADYITIYLGINDFGHRNQTGPDGEDYSGYIPLGSADDNTTSSYYGAWNVVLSWLRENRPFAHVGIIVTNGTHGTNGNLYRQAQIDMANKYGYPYIDLNGDKETPTMIRSCNSDIAQSVKDIINQKQAVDYSGGNLHPNDDAHLFESYFIEDFLRRI